MEVRSALVGRDDERETLSQAIARARRGSGSLVLLCGEAGVGKTRLAEELLAALSGAITEMPLLVIAAYRSDGLPRDHMLRWLRNELRRGGNLTELSLAPLDRNATAALLEQLLDGPPS